MGYQFKGTTGEFGDYGYDTGEGWVPYWNLKGEYIGMKFPSYEGVDECYRAYPAKVYVNTYWEIVNFHNITKDDYDSFMGENVVRR